MLMRAYRTKLRVMSLCIVAMTGGLTACTPRMARNILDQFVKSFGQTVSVNPADSSPPTVTLSADLGRRSIVLRDGDDPITIHVGEVSSSQFLLVAAAEDPEGVQSICIFTAGRRECSCGGIGSTSIPTFSPICDAVQVPPGGSATTRRWIVRPVDLRSVSSCGAGCSGGSTLSFSATGKNFGNQETSTPQIIFVNP